jgi:hypothetical protein
MKYQLQRLKFGPGDRETVSNVLDVPGRVVGVVGTDIQRINDQVVTVLVFVEVAE